jgi:exopolyphosphatase/pppGpp-phosphohydrolase
VIIRSILEMTEVSEALVCEAALREGVIADYLAQRFPAADDDPMAAAAGAGQSAAQLT